MFQHMRDAAGSAGKMKIEKRTEQSPTQAGPVGDGDIDLAYGRDTLADEVKARGLAYLTESSATINIQTPACSGPL